MESRTRWELAWKNLSRRIGVWSTAAEIFLRQSEHIRSPTEEAAANQAIAREAERILADIEALELPADLKAMLDDVKRLLGPVLSVTRGWDVVAYRWVVLAALRMPLDEALGTSEEPRRRLVDRAFLHLNRTLSVDEDVRWRWQTAFHDEGEPRCEQFGALHLLSHGIYAFKADAGSGRTDLMLGVPLEITDEVKAADAMVLTEWKLVRPGDDANAKAREGKAQAERYARLELAGFELRAHRYVVLVSHTPVSPPRASDFDNGVTTHYVNIVIGRIAPSDESRRAARRRAARPSATP